MQEVEDQLELRAKELKSQEAVLQAQVLEPCAAALSSPAEPSASVPQTPT